MRLEEAKRGIQLRGRITQENGASGAEAQTAAKLARALMERLAVEVEHARTAPVASSRLSWVYWENLLGEYGIGLHHFGVRGNAQLGRGLVAFINLDTGHWSVKGDRSGGSTLTASDFGEGSFRTYLRDNGRGPSLWPEDRSRRAKGRGGRRKWTLRLGSNSAQTNCGTSASPSLIAYENSGVAVMWICRLCRYINSGFCCRACGTNR